MGHSGQGRETGEGWGDSGSPALLGHVVWLGFATGLHEGCDFLVFTCWWGCRLAAVQVGLEQARPEHGQRGNRAVTGRQPRQWRT